MLQAKLIIELPEKKIEITESELRDTIRKHLDLNVSQYGNFMYELFGDKNE